MSVEAITDALHEHMYEKLNDSPETEEKKIRYLNKRKAKSIRDSKNARPEGRNAQNAKRSATTRNVAEQTRK